MKMNLRLIICILILIPALKTYSQELTEEESKLYKFVMEYRQQKGLGAIPISKSLNIVAKTHVIDLFNNKPTSENCNEHSWSSKGKWSACCYTSDHAKAKCMWNKPRELTNYKGNGYEIAYWNSDDATAENALSGWQESPGHNAVIINKGIWKQQWNAIGIGIYKNYAVIWFGNEPDNN